MSVCFQAFTVPTFRQFQREAAILYAGINIAPAILDGDAAILSMYGELAGALFQGNTAILGVCFSCSGKPAH